MPRWDIFLFVADGEGFEPPEALRLQRFSRPSHSTALPPILNFFPTVLSNLAVLVMRKLCLLLPRFAVKTVAFDRSATHPKLFPTVLSNLAVLVMRKLCLLLPRFAVKTVAFDRSATHPKLDKHR